MVRTFGSLRYNSSTSSKSTTTSPSRLMDSVGCSRSIHHCCRSDTRNTSYSQRWWSDYNCESGVNRRCSRCRCRSCGQGDWGVHMELVSIEPSTGTNVTEATLRPKQHQFVATTQANTMTTKPRRIQQSRASLEKEQSWWCLDALVRYYRDDSFILYAHCDNTFSKALVIQQKCERVSTLYCTSKTKSPQGFLDYASTGLLLR